MIVRIAGEGQFEVDDDSVAKLNELDNAAVEAVEAGDEERFRELFEQLIALVHEHGEPLDGDDLSTSDVIIPPADLTLEQAQAEFTGEGLIPG